MCIRCDNNLQKPLFFRIPCSLRQFLANYVLNVFLKRKANEIMEQIDAAIRAADAWKATVLLDSTSDYKPILVVSLFCNRSEIVC